MEVEKPPPIDENTADIIREVEALLAPENIQSDRTLSQCLSSKLMSPLDVVASFADIQALAPYGAEQVYFALQRSATVTCEWCPWTQRWWVARLPEGGTPTQCTVIIREYPGDTLSLRRALVEALTAATNDGPPPVSDAKKGGGAAIPKSPAASDAARFPLKTDPPIKSVTTSRNSTTHFVNFFSGADARYALARLNAAGILTVTGGEGTPCGRPSVASAKAGASRTDDDDDDASSPHNAQSSVGAVAFHGDIKQSAGVGFVPPDMAVSFPLLEPQQWMPPMSQHVLMEEDGEYMVPLDGGTIYPEHYKGPRQPLHPHCQGPPPPPPPYLQMMAMAAAMAGDQPAPQKRTVRNTKKRQRRRAALMRRRLNTDDTTDNAGDDNSEPPPEDDDNANSEVKEEDGGEK